MPDYPPVAEIMEIAASSASLHDRASTLLEGLDRWAPCDAAWLALTDPRSNLYAPIGSSGLDRSVTAYLDRPEVAHEIELIGLNREGPPISTADLPIAIDQLSTWSECLTPAGFREGLGVALFEPGGRHVGVLGLLYADGRAPAPALCDRLGELSPLIARALSPMRSLLDAARIVRGAVAGVVLLQDGTICPLPGLDGHALLVAESPSVEIARRSLLAGQVYRSFLWPTGNGSGGVEHARLTVLAATELPALVLGAVLVTPRPDSRGLTSRELQVLGLVVEGRSNQQIASRLAVALGTVATHVERLLDKLEAPTRTVAAVRAEREGCYVPPASLPPHPPGRKTARTQPSSLSLNIR
ncbi:LuxR C-terminal-related transcriptional regulator [Kribbella sp. NPDC056861]|uniref:helix-turn-helix transcriptional regulator n=1 Tax=Kribbella sp. NPDC056861 TaxID=3154857 RepID=UPI0034122226